MPENKRISGLTQHDITMDRRIHMGIWEGEEERVKDMSFPGIEEYRKQIPARIKLLAFNESFDFFTNTIRMPEWMDGRARDHIRDLLIKGYHV